ncbi:NUDIX hydrolase [Parvibaculum sp.]|uniref:NUDIX hydrolase n=1 Tax=Parvibaculum sp. TaxID=2024848 RepID=UPI003298EFC6
MRRTAGAFFVKDGRVLLARRAAHKETYPDCWDIVGGHVEPGETVEQALIRETMEELGVTPLQFEAVGLFAEPLPERYGEAVHHFFRVTEWRGEPSLTDDEHTELRWFTLDEACTLEDLAIPEYRELFAILLTRS